MRRKPHDRFMARPTRHLDEAEPGSLGQLVRSTPATGELKPDGQVPHWLFAFDAAVIAAFKALALVAIHPDQYDQIRSELTGRNLRDPEQVTGLARLRATVLERAYVAKRTTEGKTPREIRRCLKRYIARQLYRALTTAITP